MNATTKTNTAEITFEKGFVTKVKSAVNTVEMGRASDVAKVYELVRDMRNTRGAIAALAEETGLNRKTLDYYSIGALAWCAVEVQDVPAHVFRQHVINSTKALGTKKAQAILEGALALDVTLSAVVSAWAGAIEEVEPKERPSELEIFLKHLGEGKFDEDLDLILGSVAARQEVLAIA